MFTHLPVLYPGRMVVMRILNAKTTKSLPKEINKIKELEVSKSQKMKELFELGLEIKEVASLMGTRYQFAYNVISNWVNMNGIEVMEEERVSKKGEIIKQYLDGKSNKEISIDQKVNYNYVFKVLKEYKMEHQAIKEEVAQ